MINTLLNQSINVELTKRCNLHCKHCYVVPTESSETSLSCEEYGAFFRLFHMHGGRNVLLTGGEIFLREDLQEIVMSAVSANLKVHLFTNGTLITEHDIDWIKQFVDFVSVSVDGDEKHHDVLRGVNGSFKKVINTLQLFHLNSVPFFLQTTITPQNMDNMDWLVDVIKAYKPKMVKLGYVCSIGRGKDKNTIHLSKEKKRSLKKLGWAICEKADDYHTKVVTNVVSNQEYQMFFPDIKNGLPLWMYPDGSIYSCYPHSTEEMEYWKYSDNLIFPNVFEQAFLRHKALYRKVDFLTHNACDFDFFELISKASDEIFRERT